VKVWTSLLYSIIVSSGVLLWAAFYILFRFYIPLKWERWRAASRFRRHLIEEGIPKDLADRLTESQFKAVSLTSIWRWWRALGREKGTEHRGET
jgi:hypothetical protein